ncbi:MAG: hypothetical protein K1X57_10095 [Gemmataceae bacterium]|nr:hypothetical protein [Gemmataceae bacterium]
MLRRFPNVRRLLFALPALILVAGGVVFFLNYRQEAALRALVAETTASDPGWQLADMLAARPKQEPGETVVTVISKWDMPLVAIAKRANPFGGGTVTEIHAIKEIRETPNRKPFPETLAAIRSKDPELAAAVIDLKRLPNLPMGNWPEDPADPMRAFKLITVGGASRAAWQLQVSAALAISDGNVAGAVQDFHAAIQAGRCAGIHPGVAMIAVRMWTEQNAACIAEHLLAQLPLSDEQLDGICNAVAASLADPSAVRAFRSQRAAQFAGYDRDATSLTRRLRTARGSFVHQLGFVTGSSLRDDQIAFLIAMNQWLEVARLPVEQQSAALIKARNTIDSIDVDGIIRIKWPGDMIETDIRRQAMLRCMLVALAAERYRLARGQWPERLEQLVSAGFLKTLPADPFDGQPLGWKETPFGRIVYARGSDPKEDVDSARPYLPKGLVGFRLYNPDQRRRPVTTP